MRLPSYFHEGNKTFCEEFCHSMEIDRHNHVIFLDEDHNDAWEHVFDGLSSQACSGGFFNARVIME